MKRIFISFSQHDTGVAHVISGYLRRHHFPTWVFTRDQRIGSRIHQNIQSAIDSVDLVIVLWSENSTNSSWVVEEATESELQGKYFPILVNSSIPPLGFRNKLCHQLLIGSGNSIPHAELEKLLDAVSSHLNPIQCSTPAGSRESTQPEFKLLPQGYFVMGNQNPLFSDDACELPSRRVCISNSFSISITAVTNLQFHLFRDNHIADKKSVRLTKPNHPVTNVSWIEARAYCRWLSRPGGDTYRLPSEAEWEFACRAGSNTRYSWGNSVEPNKANYMRTNNSEIAGVSAVKLFPPNPYGLFDMHGNVAEWVEDDWHGSYDGAPDNGAAWSESPRTEVKPVRGGAWGYDAHSMRSSARLAVHYLSCVPFVGFRIVKESSKKNLSG